MKILKIFWIYRHIASDKIFTLYHICSEFSLIVRKVPLFRPSFALSQYSDGLNISFSNFSLFQLFWGKTGT